MQFHIAAICVGCRTPIAFSCDIPCRLVTNSFCGACGGAYMVGITGGFFCDECKQIHYAAQPVQESPDAST